MILARFGYRIWTARDLGQVEKILTEEDVDLCVLCRTLSYEEIEMACACVRALCPESKIITLMGGRYDLDFPSDVQVFDAWVSPVVLIETVAGVLDHAIGETTNPQVHISPLCRSFPKPN